MIRTCEFEESKVGTSTLLTAIILGERLAWRGHAAWLRVAIWLCDDGYQS